MDGMKVAVTGGEGFIGQAVCRQLLARHAVPIVIDRTHGLDVVDARGVLEAMEGADAVIHLAGVLGTSELFEEPEAAITVNIQGTINVLKACYRHDARYVGITMPQVWDNVYQVTKNAAMGLARAWHKHYDIPVSHVRAFNVFGPGQKVGSPQKIIPTFASKMWAGEAVPVWGDGLQTVDLIFVDDVARMLCDAVYFGDDQVFDAGTGHQMTVVDVVCLMSTIISNWVMDIEYLPMRKGENEGTKVGATGEGWDLLGWRPHFARDDLELTVLSYRS